jgi:hypothetical protein
MNTPVHYEHAPNTLVITNLNKRDISMFDALSNLQQSEHTALRKVMLFCFVLTSAFTLTACQAVDKETVKGLGVELLNYSQDSIVSVKINGANTGVHTGRAKIGGAMGGGIICCSGEISTARANADVTIETVKFVNGKNGAVAYETYTTQALIELPLPPSDLRDTLVIHVLPGRKVVLEVTPGPARPRQDLMDAQIKALGLKKEDDDSSYMRSERPKYTGYPKPE